MGSMLDAAHVRSINQDGVVERQSGTIVCLHVERIVLTLINHELATPGRAHVVGTVICDEARRPIKVNGGVDPLNGGCAVLELIVEILCRETTGAELIHNRQVV